MSEFIKVGNKIVTKPNGLDCDLCDGLLCSKSHDVLLYCCFGRNGPRRNSSNF